MRVLLVLFEHELSRIKRIMAKDWKGGSASTFKTIGASNHTDHERGDADYYATEPAATDWLCKIEQFKSPILEPSCGEGHISRQLIANGYEVVSRAEWVKYGIIAPLLYVLITAIV